MPPVARKRDVARDRRGGRGGGPQEAARTRVSAFALAAAGRLGTGAGRPGRALKLDVPFDAPGPFLLRVEPVGNLPVKVELRSSVGLTPVDDPDDDHALMFDTPWMGAADYAGDID